MANEILSYDDALGIAYFIPAHFDIPEVVEVTRWRVKGGSVIRAGSLLAEIFWNDGTFEEMKSPAGCFGTVAATNRRIKYLQLGNQPPQFALRMV